METDRFPALAKWPRVSWTSALVVLLLALLWILILFGAQFGPIDDHELLRTIRQGELLPPFILADIGRFYPLGAIEYNLLTPLSRPSAGLFYLFNFAEYALLFVMLWRILAVASRRLRPALALYLALSPGIATAYYRLIVPEKGALLFYVGCVYCYFEFLKTRRPWVGLLCVLSGTLALYFKEPGFLMLGAFASLHWGFRRLARSDSKGNALLDLALIVSAACFVVAYYWWVYRNMGPHRYGATELNQVVVLTKAVINFSLSDPLIAILLPALIGYRVVSIMSRRDTLHPLYDAMAIAALCYAAAFVALKMNANYYLLPCYAFALPSIAFFADRYTAQLRSNRLLTAFIALALVLCVNALAIGLSLLSLNKYLPINYSAMLERLPAELPLDRRTDIYLDGVNPATGVEIYVSLARYLESLGVTSARFDLKSTEKPDDAFLPAKGRHSAYSILRNGNTSEPRAGDLLIITPSSSRGASAGYLGELQREYRLVFATRSPFFVPEFSIKSCLKMFARPFLGGYAALFAEEKHQVFPDYYILRKI